MAATTEALATIMVSAPKASWTPKPNPHDTQMCKSHALFLHALPDGALLLWPILFTAAAIILTQCIRANTPGVVKPPVPKPEASTTAPTTTPENTETTAIPAAADGADVEAGRGGSEEPPPYAPPAPTPVPSTTVPAPATPAVAAVKRSSAHLFVLGTFLIIPLLFSILCLALTIQYMTFCHNWSPSSTTVQVFCWLFFSGIAIFGTYGVSCYAMLLRDLWGPAAKKKFPFDEHIIGKAIFWTVGGIIMFPFISLGMISIKAVEAAQRRWCLDALADDEEVEIGELGRTDEIDRQSQDIRVEGESSEGGGERHEETAGLMKGMET